jgi:hypothetical protein
MTFFTHLTQVLYRFKVSSMTVFDLHMVQQFLEEARHAPNPTSTALTNMKMPTGKLV